MIVERVLESVLYDPKSWVACLVTEEAGRGGEVGVLDCWGLPAAAPLRHRVGRKSSMES